MTREKVFQRVRDIIVKRLKVRHEDVKESALLIEDLKADSLDVVEMVMEVEEVFGITIPDEEIKKLLANPYQNLTFGTSFSASTSISKYS